MVAAGARGHEMTALGILRCLDGAVTSFLPAKYSAARRARIPASRPNTLTNSADGSDAYRSPPAVLSSVIADAVDRALLASTF